MRGVYTTRAGQRAVARETFELKEEPGGASLQARGEELDPPGLAWSGHAEVGKAGGLDALEFQSAPQGRPSEITTVAVRALAGRAFITRIPPGGVPERVETEMRPGSIVLGPWLSLIGLLASGLPAQSSHGRRAVVLRLDRVEGPLRLDEGIVLQGKRTRGQGADNAVEWLTPVEVRLAGQPGRAVVKLDFGRGRLPLAARWPGEGEPREGRLEPMDAS